MLNKAPDLRLRQSEYLPDLFHAYFGSRTWGRILMNWPSVVALVGNAARDPACIGALLEGLTSLTQTSITINRADGTVLSVDAAAAASAFTAVAETAFPSPPPSRAPTASVFYRFDPSIARGNPLVSQTLVTRPS